MNGTLNHLLKMPSLLIFSSIKKCEVIFMSLGKVFRTSELTKEKKTQENSLSLLLFVLQVNSPS